MAVPADQGITQLLLAWNNGDAAALEQLTPLVHAELHHIAIHYEAWLFRELSRKESRDDA